MAEKKRKPRRKEIIMETIAELLTSEKTYFRNPERMMIILKQEINRKMRESEIKKLKPAEKTFLLQLTSAVSKRDDNIFDETCHRLRNRLSGLGGFALRVRKMALEIERIVKISSRAKDDSTALIEEERQTEKTIRQKRKKMDSNNRK